MMNTKSILAGILILSCFITGCDKETPKPSATNSSAREILLQQEWQYAYVIMGDSIMDSMTPSGEPRVGRGTYEAIELRFMRYSEDHTYELTWDISEYFNIQMEMGFNENYQPNYGYWELSDSEDILIHNKLQRYEKRYMIQELTVDTLKLKLIGDRICYYANAQDRILDTVTVNNWVQVYNRKK